MGEPPEDDAFWRRPRGHQPGAAEGSAPGWPGPAQPGGGAPAPYGGPPRTAPPPHGWRPPTVVRPAAPRSLPVQDPQAIDREEQTARTVTLGIGLIAGAVLVVLVLVLCGRWLF